MRRAAASTFFWKSGVVLRSTGTEKKARLPWQYSDSSSRARSVSPPAARRGQPAGRGGGGPLEPLPPDEGRPLRRGLDGERAQEPPGLARGLPRRLQPPPGQIARVRRGREVSREDLVHAVSPHAASPF